MGSVPIFIGYTILRSIGFERNDSDWKNLTERLLVLIETWQWLKWQVTFKACYELYRLANVKSDTGHVMMTWAQA